MNIQIEHQRRFFGSNYEISTPACIYSARKVRFSWPKQISVAGPGDQHQATLVGSFSFFQSQYDFKFADGQIYHFECEKVWKGVFLCGNAQEKFQLYRHKGLNYSVFAGSTQIASFAQDRVQYGQTTHYEVLLNDDANVLLIVCMVLAVAESVDDSEVSVTYDFGNVGPEERKFDQSWTPN